MRGISGYLWFWVILVVPVALRFPYLFSPLKPFIKPLLASVILAMGLTLRKEELKAVLKKPHFLATGLLTQYSVMPLLGFLFGSLFLKSLGTELIAGQVLTGSCPTGVVSNVYNFLAGSNLALSLALSAVNTAVSPFLTPLLTKALIGKEISVDTSGIFLDMVQITLIPIFLGICFNTLLPEKVNRIKPFLPAYSSLAVVVIVGFVVSAGSSKVLSFPLKAFLLLLMASIFHLLFGFWFGYIVPRLLKLKPKERVTISIETAMQNSGLATVLAVSHFGALAALPGVFYSIIQNLLGPFVVKIFRLVHGKHLNVAG